MLQPDLLRIRMLINAAADSRHKLRALTRGFSPLRGRCYRYDRGQIPSVAWHRAVTPGAAAQPRRTPWDRPVMTIWAAMTVMITPIRRVTTLMMLGRRWSISFSPERKAR